MIQMIQSAAAKAAQSPLIINAYKFLATQIAHYGIVGAADKLLDHVAYKIALHIIDEEDRITKEK